MEHKEEQVGSAICNKDCTGVHVAAAVSES